MSGYRKKNLRVNKMCFASLMAFLLFITTISPLSGTVSASVINNQTVVLYPNMISNQIDDPKLEEVKVDIIPFLSFEHSEVQLPNESVEIMRKSTKPLVLISSDIKVVVPNEVFDEPVKQGFLNMSFIVNRSESATVNGAVSATYEFSKVTEAYSTFMNIPQKTWKVYEIDKRFSRPIEFIVPTTVSVKDPRKVAAYNLREATGAFEYVGGTFNSDDKFIFSANDTSRITVIEQDKTFNDIQNHWAQEQIEVLASRNITSGRSEKIFDPKGNITRAEFTVMIAHAINLNANKHEWELVENQERIFQDLQMSKAWAYKEVEDAYTAGIVKGTSKNTFSPDSLISRQEIAAILIRAIEFQDSNLLNGLDTPKPFADDNKIGTFARKPVNQAVSLGIISGRGGNLFDPQANATRAEAAVMLYRTLGKLSEL